VEAAGGGRATLGELAGVVAGGGSATTVVVVVSSGTAVGMGRITLVFKVESHGMLGIEILGILGMPVPSGILTLIDGFPSAGLPGDALLHIVRYYTIIARYVSMLGRQLTLLRLLRGLG
jgi:hypothetical protein